MESLCCKLKDVFASLETVYSAAAMAEEGLWEHAKAMLTSGSGAYPNRVTLRDFIKEVGLEGVPVVFGVGRI